MKKILSVLALVILSISAYSQFIVDGDTLTISKDKFTGKTTVSSKLVIFNDAKGNYFGFIVKRTKGDWHPSLAIIMQLKGSSNCVKEYARSLFLTKNGDKVEMMNSYDFNCDGTFLFPLLKIHYNDFEKSLITDIRLNTGDDLYDVEVPQEYASEIRQHMISMMKVNMKAFK